MNTKYGKLLLLTFFIFIGVTLFGEQNQNKIVLERIDLKRIKKLEMEFRRKNKKELWSRYAVCVAGVSAALVAVSGIIYDYTKTPEGEGSDSLPRETSEVDVKQKIDVLVFKELVRSRSLREHFVLVFLGIVAIKSVDIMLSSFSEIYEKLKNWWQKKMDWASFHLEESCNNLANIGRFLDGMMFENVNFSYIQFYCKQLVSIHKMLLFSIEHLIAAMAATLDKDKNHETRNWLLSEENGLIEDTNALTDSLSSMLNELPDDLKSSIGKSLTPLMYRLMFALQRFKDDFKIV